jgi:hypothetical protein
MNLKRYTYPHIESGWGKHAKRWTNDELDKQRDAFDQHGGIVPGAGTHRKEKYAHLSYHVVETGDAA